jgi:hypothetical protein
MEVVRQIDVYDNLTEFCVDEWPLPSFDLDVFKKRFNVDRDDPLMYLQYKISPATVDLFPSFKFDFDKFSYFVGCYQA